MGPATSVICTSNMRRYLRSLVVAHRSRGQKRGNHSYGSAPEGKKVKIEEVTISLARRRPGNIGIYIKINLRQAQYRIGQAPRLDLIPPLLLSRFLPLPKKILMCKSVHDVVVNFIIALFSTIERRLLYADFFDIMKMTTVIGVRAFDLENIEAIPTTRGCDFEIQGH